MGQRYRKMKSSMNGKSNIGSNISKGITWYRMRVTNTEVKQHAIQVKGDTSTDSSLMSTTGTPIK